MRLTVAIYTISMRLYKNDGINKVDVMHYHNIMNHHYNTLQYNNFNNKLFVHQTDKHKHINYTQ